MHAKDRVHHFVPAYEMALLIVINRMNVIDLLEGQQKASMGDGHGSSNRNRGCTYINFAFARSWKDRQTDCHLLPGRYQGLAKAAKTIGHLLHAQPISLIQRTSFQYKLCLSQWCLVACHTILNYTHEPCK
jgi:hypothetical protein